VSAAANDNEIRQRPETLQALDQIFPDVMPILYQGNLATLVESVVNAANSIHLSRDGLKETLDEYEAHVEQGATLEQQQAFLNDRLGNTQAAAAYVILYGVRETAYSLILLSRASTISKTIRDVGSASSNSLVLRVKINRLRRNLEQALTDIGGVGEQSAKQFVRQFEIAANEALDAKLGTRESLSP
jgi:hypothetical protein